MSNNQNHKSEVFTSPLCRFSFVQDMFKRVPKKREDGTIVLDSQGNEVTLQRCTLIFDDTPENRAPFNAAMREVMEAHWGEKARSLFENDLIKNPILAGDSKAAKSKKTGEIFPGFGPGKFFVRVASQLEVPVRYKQKAVPAQYGGGPDQIKSGDYGIAALHVYSWWNERSGNGMSVGIDYLQKLHDGEALGGDGTSGINVDDYFVKIDGADKAGLAEGGGSIFGDAPAAGQMDASSEARRRVANIFG